MELKVGDKLYIPVKSRVMNDRIEEVSVTKVGRLYYELDHRQYSKVRKDDLTYRDPNYSQNNFCAYRSIEEYENFIEMNRKRDVVNRFFRDWNRLPDEDVEAVYQIIIKHKP